MKRSIAALAVLAALGFAAAAAAQPLVKEARVGVLLPSNAVVTRHLSDAFLQGLRSHGYVEGQNLKLERRYGEGRHERLPELAAELVRLDLQVIVTATEPAIAALKHATQRIPIVMANSSDPVGTGLIASLARPGGNITGYSTFAPEVSGKRLAVMKEAIPGLSRVVLLWNPDARSNVLDRNEIEAAGRLLHVEVHAVDVRRLADLDAALLRAVALDPQSLIFPAQDPVFFVMRGQIAAFAATHRLPTMLPLREFVEDGGLMSYGPNVRDMYRGAADYVVKILNGAKPGDLPVAQPTTYELVVNLKTAKALGITFPRTILERADEVIE